MIYFQLFTTFGYKNLKNSDDKTTGEYSVKRRKDGSAKVQVADIEKGIVFDGMSFNDNANVIDVTSNGAHLSNVEKFLVDFSDNCLNKEIAGTYYSSNNSDSVDYVHIGATKNNSETESYSVPSIYSVRRDLFGNIRPVGHWHTHPSNRSWDSRSTPSTQDLNFRSRHPEIPHFILTNSDYGNSVEKIPY